MKLFTKDRVLWAVPFDEAHGAYGAGSARSSIPGLHDTQPPWERPLYRYFKLQWFALWNAGKRVDFDPEEHI